MNPETVCAALSALSVATASLGTGFFVTRLCMYLRAHGTPVQIINPEPVTQTVTFQEKPNPTFTMTVEPSLNGHRG